VDHLELVMEGPSRVARHVASGPSRTDR
jgi:hypothetical protein